MSRALSFNNIIINPYLIGMHSDFVGEDVQIENSNSLDTKTALMLFVALVIVAIYLVCLLLIVIRRAKKLIELYNRRYYIIVIFYVASKLIICAILSIEVVFGFTNTWSNLDPVQVELLVKTGIVLADFSIIQLFLISLEHYFGLCLSTLKDTLSRKQSKMITIALKGFQILVALIIFIPLIILEVDLIAYNILNGIGLGLDLLVVIFFLATFFYFNFKMTGVLVQPRLNEVIKRVYKVQLIILVSRAFMITFELLLALYVPGSFQSKLDELEQNVQPQIVLALTFICSVLLMLFTEGLPIMYSLRSNVVQCLNYRPSTFEYKENLQDSLMENKINDSSQREEDMLKEIKLKNFKKLQDIQLEKEEESIWILKKGTVDHKDYIIRISKHQISNYIFQDIVNQISLWNQLSIPSLSKLSYFYEGQIIHFVEKFYSQNLDSLVDKVVGQSELIKLAIKLAESITQLHENDIVHGCISPRHIFLYRDKMILNGCGLHSLRKYLSLITGYTNKTMYTATEHLKDKNNVILKPQRAADVYSFGIVLYEIVTRNRQYRQLSLKEVIVKFAEENFRPKLPEYTKSQLKNLIRRCWHENPDRRPEMQEVIDQLRRFV